MWLYLTPDALSGLIDSLLGNLHDLLDQPMVLEEKIKITDEAHQYLNGVHALFASGGGEGLADGQIGLLEHILENAHARINEQQERLRDRRMAREAAVTFQQPAVLH